MSNNELAVKMKAIGEAFLRDEAEVTNSLINNFPLCESERTKVFEHACAIVSQSRYLRDQQRTLDVFLAEFGLSNQEGVALMCLAEALLRIPDTDTQDKLIAEKIKSGDWASHKGRSESAFVNASTWGLMLTGSIVEMDKAITRNPSKWMNSLIARSGEPVIRKAVMQAMKIMGREFVFGRNIKEGLKRQKKQPTHQRMMSFDMLGEGARTMADAERYFSLYSDAIHAVGSAVKSDGSDPHDRSSISIKLSALHPRYENINAERIMAELLPKLIDLAAIAKSYDIQFTMDAEEADRLELSLNIFEALARDARLENWQGLGLAVQAYSKRAPYVIDWLIELAHQTKRQFAVRLVKGAYWDTEIKYAQELGLPDYPVFTRKAATDICYLYTAKKMIDAPEEIYSQFSTHNAHTIAAISTMAKDIRYEFQRLHGMGALLFEAAGKVAGAPIRTRTYSPVGQHEDLLPYLVRRLLENGANSSFINCFMDADVPVETVALDPIDEIKAAPALRHTMIPTPDKLYGASRINSAGCNIMDRIQSTPLISALKANISKSYQGGSIVCGKLTGGEPQNVNNPADMKTTVGTVKNARPNDIDAALTAAQAAQPAWNRLGGAKRAEILRSIANAIETDRDIFVDLLVREAGKTLGDCIAEIREAVDFCRYYAEQADKHFERATILPGPTGESNELFLCGRGTFLCISPWNFPLAIFTGQVVAALAAGNAVIAKPAEQTPLISWHAVNLFIKAGVPVDVVHLLCGSGAEVGGKLTADERISGVCFTGSTATAKHINRTLANRDGAIIPLIAETGGQNVMIVDSTALPEQVSDDVILSAFGSAGQRCSALRVLFLQETIADKQIEILKGALKEQRIGNPAMLKTDVGPIIDNIALKRLEDHCADMEQQGKLIAKAEITPECKSGTFLAPHIFEIDSLNQLKEEHFGPILHIVRFKADNLAQVLADINATGYGLTFGVHSRLEARWRELFEGTRCGNTYINRNMTGAVVGVQPFGGEGLSGTGPKAGGPHYLFRFASERTRTINIAAIGGNADLFSMKE